MKYVKCVPFYSKINELDNKCIYEIIKEIIS